MLSGAMNVAAVKPVNTCCDKCKDICFDISSSIVSDSIYAAKVKLSENSLKKDDFLENGYTKGVLCKDKELELLRNLELLQQYKAYGKINNFQKCLCDNEIQKLVDNILGIADIACCSDPKRKDVVIDTSGYDQWVLKNPNCIVYESWEASYLGICTKFSLDSVFLETPPKLLYDISVANISNKCDLVMAISIQNEKPCDVNADINVTLEDCKLQYDLLVSEHKCDLTFNAYVEMIKCGVKAEVISKIVGCGLNVRFNAEKKSCDIMLEDNISVTLSDAKFCFEEKNINCEAASEILGVQICS